MTTKLPEKITTEAKVRTVPIPDNFNIDETLESDWYEIFDSEAWEYTDEEWLED